MLSHLVAPIQKPVAHMSQLDTSRSLNQKEINIQILASTAVESKKDRLAQHFTVVWTKKGDLPTSNVWEHNRCVFVS